MKSYAREIIQNAGLMSGILDVFAVAEDNELRAYLHLLNGILAEFNNAQYFPYAKNLYTIGATVSPSVITIGKDEVYPTGLTDAMLSGSITGLTNQITGVGTVPTFTDAVVSLSDGTQYYIPGTSTLISGTVTSQQTGGIFDITAGTPTFTAPNLEIGDTLTLATLVLSTSAGTYVHVDVFDEAPRFIASAAYLRDNVYRSLTSISEDDYDRSDRLDESTGAEPRYYIVRGDYPITTIQLYPLTSVANFKVTAEKQAGPYVFDDVVQLPGGYIPALEQELAYRIAVMNGATEKLQMLREMAKSSLSKIKRINDKPVVLNNNASYGGNRYNINTDTWS
jgi:hypothetical protein